MSRNVLIEERISWLQSFGWGIFRYIRSLSLRFLFRCLALQPKKKKKRHCSSYCSSTLFTGNVHPTLFTLLFIRTQNLLVCFLLCVVSSLLIISVHNLFLRWSRWLCHQFCPFVCHVVAWKSVQTWLCLASSILPCMFLCCVKSARNFVGLRESNFYPFIRSCCEQSVRKLFRGIESFVASKFLVVGVPTLLPNSVQVVSHSRRQQGNKRATARVSLWRLGFPLCG